LHVTGQTAPSGGNGNGGNRHNDGAAAGAGTDTPSNDPEPAPTPAPAYTAAAYAEVVDPNYSSTDAPYRVVTSDNVVFYLSTKLVAQW
jgi:hypothetical protein